MRYKRQSGRGLFDELISDDDVSTTVAPWTLAEFPILDGIKNVCVDFETDGLKWWDGAKPIGFGLEWEGQTRYFSWGHKCDAPRHDEETAKRWFREQLKGKRIANSAIKTEVHFAEEWLGYSLEELGCQVTDVQYLAALLDDHRKQFSQEILCKEFLPENERKVLVVNGIEIQPNKMAWHQPGIVAVRAEADVRQVRMLMNLFEPEIAEQSLEDTLTLEETCTWATCEMERNAVLIDVHKLRRWAKECRDEYDKLIMEIKTKTGIRFNPDSGTSWTELFEKRDIVNSEFTKGKRPKKSYTDSILLGTIVATNDPIISMARQAGKLADLLSKYLDKWVKTVGEDGRLRFNLHQLRSDEGGTVSGRFASAAIDTGEGKIGTNVQAILALEKQLDLYGPNWIIRELIIAADGKRVISADAEQIEYRLLANLAGNKRIFAAYEENPRLSFHKLIHGYLLPYKPNLGYKNLKNINFMRIYGGGLVKLALMLGNITATDADELHAMDKEARKEREKYGGRPIDLPSRRDPRLITTLEIERIYDRELPEVKPLTKQSTMQAVDRGWVTTLKGRRARFEKDWSGMTERPHKALNARIQGSAGDILKTKMIEVHKAAKQLNFTPRFTVHDQLVGDGIPGETKQALSKLLDTQSFPDLKVPILWAITEGDNLKECDEQH